MEFVLLLEFGEIHLEGVNLISHHLVVLLARHLLELLLDITQGFQGGTVCYVALHLAQVGVNVIKLLLNPSECLLNVSEMLIELSLLFFVIFIRHVSV